MEKYNFNPGPAPVQSEQSEERIEHTEKSSFNKLKLLLLGAFSLASTELHAGDLSKFRSYEQLDSLRSSALNTISNLEVKEDSVVLPEKTILYTVSSHFNQEKNANEKDILITEKRHDGSLVTMKDHHGVGMPDYISVGKDVEDFKERIGVQYHIKGDLSQELAYGFLENMHITSDDLPGDEKQSHAKHKKNQPELWNVELNQHEKKALVAEYETVYTEDLKEIRKSQKEMVEIGPNMYYYKLDTREHFSSSELKTDVPSVVMIWSYKKQLDDFVTHFKKDNLGLKYYFIEGKLGTDPQNDQFFDDVRMDGSYMYLVLDNKYTLLHTPPHVCADPVVFFTQEVKDRIEKLHLKK